MAAKLQIVRHITRLRNTDFCSILQDCKNVNDPLIVRIYVKAEETSVEYNCSDTSDNWLNPYYGGYFILEIFFGGTFPDRVPTVIFKTPIIHANVSEKDGYICLSALNNWDSGRDNLTDNVIAPIVGMLNKPAFEDAIHTSEKEVPFKDYDEIRKRVKSEATLEKSDEQFELIKKRLKQEKLNAASKQ